MNNSFIKKINFFPRLKEWQKVTLVIILGVFLTSTLFLSYKFVADTNFRESFFSITTGKNTVTNQRDAFVTDQVNKINNILEKINIAPEFYSEYTFASLDIYPDGFRKRFFSGPELTNESISGQNGDPDGDGLINKLEFFYGSNPKERKSLCAKVGVGVKPIETSPFVCDDRSDYDLVKGFISPLSGLDLDTADKFRVLNQDISVINNIKNTFDQAANDGVDLPTLYQESLLINLEDQVNSISNVRVLEDNAKNILEYRSFRLEILDILIGSDQVSPLSQIYTANTIQQIDSLKIQYQKILDRIKSISAPKAYEATHKLYQMLFSKLIDLADHRKGGITNNDFETEQYKAKSKKLSIEATWIYRRLKEEGAKNDAKFNR